jgi:predicted Zn-dependent protease
MSHHSHIPPHIDWVVRSFIRRHRRGLKLGGLAALCMGLVLALGAGWAAFRGFVYVKDWVVTKGVMRIPLQWEQPLGQAALAHLRNQNRFNTDPKMLEPLIRLAAPLFANQTNVAERFTLLLTESKEINAMALPGGFIVLHRGLLERARSAEEVQGVLAHEMAHVTKRHSVLQLAQNLGLGLALQQLQGNESGLREMLLSDSAKLVGLRFSRDHERAADDLAWEWLQKAQINPQGMVDFFAAMKTEMDAKGQGGFALGSALLSTHPTPQERIDRLRRKQTLSGAGEFKSFAADFEALQQQLRRGLLLEEAESAAQKQQIPAL